MSEHPFRPDHWLPANHKGERVCMCGLPEKSRYHVPPPQTPDEDVSERIIGEGEQGGRDQGDTD